MHMGRNKLVKRLVLLLLFVTCVISVVILINLYVISTSEEQKFPRWELHEEKNEKPLNPIGVDPELVDLEKRIGYILKLYKNGKQPNLGINLDGDPNDMRGPKMKIDNHFLENAKEKLNHKSKSKIRFHFPNARPAMTPLKQFKYIAKRTSPSVPGVLNAHIWEGWCGPRVEDLKRDKHFPLYPSFKTNVSLFFAQWNEAGYGERIFGYIHPPETGNYIFAVSCDDNCEIWLSNTTDPKDIQKIAYVGTLNIPANTKLANFRQYQSQISRQIYLKAGNKYYIEALHKQAAYKDHLLLTWLAPSWQRIRTISSKYISSFISAHFENIVIEDYAKYIPETRATFVGEQIYNNIGNIYYFNRTKYKFGSHDKRYSNVSSHSVEPSDFANILPSINYKPSYVLDFVPKRYEGVKLVHESSVYPNDNTVLTHMYAYEDCLTHRYNYPHLTDIFQGNSMKTSIDEEYWYSQLSFNDKFKYLSNLYGKKIKYIIHKIKKTNNIKKKKKKGDNINIENDGNEKSESMIETEEVVNNPHQHEVQSNKINRNIDTDTNTIHSIFSKQARLPNEKAKAIKLEVQNGKLGSSNVRGRKLLSLRDSDEENKTLDDEKSNQESVITRSNRHVEIRSRERKGKSFNVDNDVLPSNLMENSIRSRPISIPGFVRTYHQSEYSNRYNEVNSPSNTREPDVTQTTIKKYKKIKRVQYLPRRQKIPPLIEKKIFFRDGEVINGTNKTEQDHYHMARMYNIFGPAVYHLSQVPERHFQWLYNQHLSNCKTDGNLQLSEEIAVGVVHDYMQEVKRRHGSKYSLRRIINVEENHDVIHGDRYLIEIDLNVKKQKHPRYLSRYIYRPLGSNKLFEISDFSWNEYATVHIIIPVKDQGRWVKHFIANMERIFRSTKDPYLNIIIVDFNSTDIDIKKSLKKSILQRYQVISLNGSFQRALGIQAGADAVENPNDIIFACDLHLEIPAHLITSIRKHTVKAKMAFAPMVFRLSCGYTPELPFGLWEIQGYGLFAISKYDFVQIGGMNTKEFKTKWGGEDWEFLDRTLAFGLQVERMRIPHFYHYYHSKKRMWIAPKTTLPPLVNVETL